MAATLEARGTSIFDAAKALVSANVEAEPEIVRAYLFPSDREIRLIYVDPTTSPLSAGERVAPYYFGSNRAEGLQYRAAIALVRPSEENNSLLPEGWGSWGDAKTLWEK